MLELPDGVEDFLLAERLDDETLDAVLLREPDVFLVIIARDHDEECLRIQLPDFVGELVTLIVKVLEKHGCQVFTATNGRDAVEMVRGNSYDMILMDCQMPEMDGFEAARIIRQEEAVCGSHINIVVLTADAMTGDREKRLSAGMDDYLNKPFKPEQITQMLAKWALPAAAT